MTKHFGLGAVFNKTIVFRPPPSDVMLYDTTLLQTAPKHVYLEV